MKTRVNLSIDSELVAKAKKAKINLSKLLEEVLRRGFENITDQKEMFEMLYKDYFKYRVSVINYEREYALNWLRSRIEWNNYDQETLLSMLESRYNQEMQEIEKKLQLKRINISEKEAIQICYQVYQHFKRNNISEIRIIDYLRHRISIYHLSLSPTQLLKKLKLKEKEQNENSGNNNNV